MGTVSLAARSGRSLVSGLLGPRYLTLFLANLGAAGFPRPAGSGREVRLVGGVGQVLLRKRVRIAFKVRA